MNVDKHQPRSPPVTLGKLSEAIAKRMSKIQWAYNLVERPFCEQLKAMGFQSMQDAAGGPGTGLLIGRLRVAAPA